LLIPGKKKTPSMFWEKLKKWPNLKKVIEEEN